MGSNEKTKAMRFDERENGGQEARRGSGRAMQVAKRDDTEPRMFRAVRLLRTILPGDSEFGDTVSTAGTEASHVLGRRVSEVHPQRASVVRETGLAALQVWQAISEVQGRGRGNQEVTILFTDLVGFSSWALNVGDTMALEMIRQVGDVVESEIREHGGRVVKRLGDGWMAVFIDPNDAVKAVQAANEKLQKIEVAGRRPEQRAGLHVGRPRQLRGDYLGVDVNIASRVAQTAEGGEILVSEAARSYLDEDSFKFGRECRIKAKGTPKDLRIVAVKA